MAGHRARQEPGPAPTHQTAQPGLGRTGTREPESPDLREGHPAGLKSHVTPGDREPLPSAALPGEAAGSLGSDPLAASRKCSLSQFDQAQGRGAFHDAERHQCRAAWGGNRDRPARKFRLACAASRQAKENTHDDTSPAHAGRSLRQRLSRSIADSGRTRSAGSRPASSCAFQATWLSRMAATAKLKQCRRAPAARARTERSAFVGSSRTESPSMRTIPTPGVWDWV